ncbi:hypothetical protein TH1_055 [Shewanella phage Thanatos-1]|nr:hypothetical protein TH1_055 [Shewanella phage Thanatos-1]QLA10626.1 hypothetical protein TH2_058 [Shewanella phage Thanatos-2]
MKLRYKQRQLLELIDRGYEFKVGLNSKGPTLQGIPNYNPTLYATLTMRSLIKRKMIIIEGNTLKRIL